MIVPSAPQVPPRLSVPIAVSQSDIAAPPETDTFLSFRLAKNPIHRPSGEKNGCLAPSVPDSAVSSDRSSRRVYSILF